LSGCWNWVDEAMARDEEAIPYELVKQLLEGGNPIRLWRQHRGLTQAQLAEKAKCGPILINSPLFSWIR
jgi:hypothetical protein